MGAACLFIPILMISHFLGPEYREVCTRTCRRCGKSQKMQRHNNGNWKKCR